MNLQIFTAWEDVKKICDPEALPKFHNDIFSLSAQQELPETVFVWKQETGNTLLELLDLAATESCGDSARLARQLYENEYRAALQARQEDGAENGLSLLSSFTDPNFIGAVWFHVPVQIHQQSPFGTDFYLKNCNFEAVFVRVDGPVVAGREKECALSGCILGKKKEINPNDLFQVKAVKTFFSADDLTLVTADCSFLPSGLFDQSGAGWDAIELHGVYVGGTYRYAFCNFVNYPIMNRSLRSVSVETITVTTRQQGEIPVLVLKCGGKLRLQQIDPNFDPFGYGPTDVQTDGFLDYDNLQITVQSGDQEQVEFNYREMILNDEGACVRAGSLLDCFPHGTLEFLCFQNASTPEALGYHRIQCPATQSKLEEHWYGLSIPLTLCNRVEIKLLFAFGKNGFYAGSNLFNDGSSAGLTFALDELFEIHCTTIALLSHTQKDGKKVVTLYLKGIRVSLFGLTFPPDACSIVFLARGSSQAPGWYAVYGQGSEA